jgi:hypothetical protein
MRPQFPLFQSHLDLAHSYWKEIVQPGDIVIDGTCGNGHDTLILCQLALSNGAGLVFAFDIQACAIANTKQLLSEKLFPEQFQRVTFINASHQNMPENLQPNAVKLLAYNLGYLPGGDKTLTTQSSGTIASLMAAEALIMPGGIISITCYPGHPAGQIEEEALLQYSRELPPSLWSCCHHRWTNRRQSPSLLIIQKRSLAKGMETEKQKLAKEFREASHDVERNAEIELWNPT